MSGSENEDSRVAVERARRERNVALGLVLAGFAALFFVMTIVRLGGQIGP
jgi:hypothetical protein